MTMEQYQPTAAELIPFETVEKMAHAIAKSGLFGMKKPEEALALMLIAQAEGRHPAEAARDYHIVQGRPTLKADTILARFQLAGGIVRWAKYGDAEVTGIFSHPASPEPVEVTWNMEKATKAKLAGKDVWKQYPAAMMRSRVIAEGVRTVYPAVLIGMYTPEEVQDFAPTQEPTQTIEAQVDVTPVVEPKKKSMPKTVVTAIPPIPVSPSPLFQVKTAVARIFTVLPDEDFETRVIVEEYGIVLPECPPTEFRGVLAECLEDQIKDRDHAGEIYKALLAESNAEPELMFQAATDSPDTIPEG